MEQTGCVRVFRALMAASVVPGFVLHHSTSRVWQRLQGCCASTADLQALLESATATHRALQQPFAHIMAPLLQVCPL